LQNVVNERSSGVANLRRVWATIASNIGRLLEGLVEFGVGVGSGSEHHEKPAPGNSANGQTYKQTNQENHLKAQETKLTYHS
jgi:hypothetical protein